MGEKVIINIKTFADGHKPPDRVIPAMSETRRSRDPRRCETDALHARQIEPKNILATH